MAKIAPSILSADFANLERDIGRISTADYVHVDVMDGVFVPNISIGIPVVKSLRKVTGMPLDVHLMIDRPIRPGFADGFKREATIAVAMRGEPVEFINELEWVDGKIWANVYTTNYIVIINPETGVVEGMIDCEGLLSDEDITTRTDVLNGIAYDAATKRIFVTGKRWNKLFEIEIVKR